MYRSIKLVEAMVLLACGLLILFAGWNILGLVVALLVVFDWLLARHVERRG